MFEYFNPEIIPLELLDQPKALSPNKKGKTEIPWVPGFNLKSSLLKFSNLGSFRLL